MAEETTPPVDEAYTAFMDACMQEHLDAMPDMAVRRAHCQAQWDATHPPETPAQAKRGQARESAQTEKDAAESPKP